MNEILQMVLFGGIIFALVILILLKPYLGVVFTLASLPAVDLLPAIPFLTSVVILIGVVTLVGFLLQRKKTGKSLFNFGSVHIVGLLFVGWLFISNPQAAWFGADRNWFLTFFQLWVLIWLTGELLDSPRKQHIFMLIFSVVSAISAVIVVQQGRIGETIGTSIRAGGLADQPNSSARYFVVAMIFFSYFATVMNKRLPRLLAIGGGIITFLGVFFTLSRTGILLLFVALGLIILLNARGKSRYLLVFAYTIAALVLSYLSDKIFNIIQSIVPSILQGTDTIGLRYELWQAAWRMWLDHILQGVGIGMYPAHLRYYAPGLLPHYWTEQAHNTYLMVLAEIGIVGFVLFFLLLFFSLKNFLQSGKIDDFKIVSLRNVWLTVFLVVLLGGTTSNGHYDKLLWFLMGVSVYFHNQFSMRTQKNSVHKLDSRA